VISPPSAQSDSAISFFLGGAVFEKGYRRDKRTDYDAKKYVKRRGFAQGSAFLGSQNQYLTFEPNFPKLSAKIMHGPRYKRRMNFCACAKSRDLLKVP